MLFNSLSFLLLFLPAVLGVALRLRGAALLRWLALSSFAFYALAGRSWFLAPMLVTTALDFWIAPRLAASGGARRRAWLLLSLCGNLGLLFYFKYGGLFARTFHTSAAWASLFDVALPAGISFYTFQTMSYVIDVYRGHAQPETDFWRFAGFVSFFPHLVAGPLTRHDQLIPGLTRIAETGIAPRWRAASYLFFIGLCKKTLLADPIAARVDPLLEHASALGLWGSWAALLGFSLQIYFDFSGYSDMAIGLGRLFSIELPLNFDSPYRACDPSDFWRRWHVTLSRWLRDYLYVPLGGSRVSPARTAFNLFATMTLGGLWHGARWTFAAWGFYHGLLLAAYHGGAARWDALSAAPRRAATFGLVTLGWVFFRAPDFPSAAAWFAGLAGLRGRGPAPEPSLALLLAAGLMVAQWPRNAAAERDLDALRWPAQIALGLASAAAILMLNLSSRFLYFQF